MYTVFRCNDESLNFENFPEIEFVKAIRIWTLKAKKLKLPRTLVSLKFLRKSFEICTIKTPCDTSWLYFMGGSFFGVRGGCLFGNGKNSLTDIDKKKVQCY